MHKTLFSSALAVALGLGAAAAAATPFTTTSPTSAGAVPSRITTVGGVVLDLIGSNNARVISQISASDLFSGLAFTGTPVAYQGNPFTIGIQSGFTPAVVAALGGGISEMAIRFTLFDGDSKLGELDHNQHTLQVNGIDFGNWSTVNAQQTNGSGTIAGSMSGGGFRDDILDTGWFYNNHAPTLAAFFATLGSGTVTYSLLDNTPDDNRFEFTRGMAGGSMNVRPPPTATNPVPEPASLALLGLGLAGLAAMRRRRA